MHVSCRNSETSVNDQSQDENRGGRHGLLIVRNGQMPRQRKTTCERVRDRAPMERKYIDIVNVHMNVNR
jgi:hypothetical protein